MNSDNIAFILSILSSLENRRETDYSILDYGCGDGKSIELGLKQGFDMQGVEIFAHGSDVQTKESLKIKGLLGTRVKELPKTGIIPHPDQSFDVVISNQVFEHIPKIEIPLSEINRILKSNGIFINCFPYKGAIREAHSFVPFAHRLPSHSRILYLWLFFCRLVGLGRRKKEKNPSKWAKHWMKWVPENVYYLNLNEIHCSYLKFFEFEHLEYEYCLFRLSKTKLAPLTSLFKIPFLKWVPVWVARKFGSLVILAKPLKPHRPSQSAQELPPL